MTDASTPTLPARDLRMRYGEVDVLEGVVFDAARGEVLVLLGPNGRQDNNGRDSGGLPDEVRR